MEDFLSDLKTFYIERSSPKKAMVKAGNASSMGDIKLGQSLFMRRDNAFGFELNITGEIKSAMIPDNNCFIS